MIRGGYGLFWVPTIYRHRARRRSARAATRPPRRYLASTDGNLTPVGLALEPVSQRRRPAAGQLARPAHRRRRRHRLRRPGLEAGLRAAVLGRLAARAARRDGDRRRLHGQPLRAAEPMGGTCDATVNINQLDPQYQALGTALQQTRAEPVLRHRRQFGNLSRSATIARGQLLRPYPAVRQRADAPRQPGAGALQRHDHALEQADDERLRARRQLHLQPPRGQPVRRDRTRSRTAQGSALDNYDLDGEFGVSLLDVTHRLNVNATFAAAVRRRPQVARRRRRRRAARRLDGDGGRAAIRPGSR